MQSNDIVYKAVSIFSSLWATEPPWHGPLLCSCAVRLCLVGAAISDVVRPSILEHVRQMSHIRLVLLHCHLHSTRTSPKIVTIKHMSPLCRCAATDLHCSTAGSKSHLLRCNDAGHSDLKMRIYSVAHCFWPAYAARDHDSLELLGKDIQTSLYYDLSME